MATTPITNNNPITSAVLTTSGVVHYSTTPYNETSGYVRLCDSRVARGGKATTTGSVSCKRCIRIAARHGWTVSSTSNSIPLVAGMKVIITVGFAMGSVVTVEKVSGYTETNNDGSRHYMGETLTVFLLGWGIRHLHADIFEPYDY